jgi:hypothetical protein
MRERIGRIAAAALLLGLTSCASPPTRIAESKSDPQQLRDIYDCLFDSRRPKSDAVTSGHVVPQRYNACMRQRGWRQSRS